MSEYKIEKGVPNIKVKRNSYPFPEMEIGDSFSFPALQDNSIRTAACHFMKREGTGKKFTISKKQSRCWRIE